MLQRYLRDCVELASDNESNGNSNDQSSLKEDKEGVVEDQQLIGKGVKQGVPALNDFKKQATMDSINFYYPCDSYTESSMEEFKWERITNQIHTKQPQKFEPKIPMLQSITELSNKDKSNDSFKRSNFSLGDADNGNKNDKAGGDAAGGEAARTSQTNNQFKSSPPRIFSRGDIPLPSQKSQGDRTTPRVNQNQINKQFQAGGARQMQGAGGNQDGGQPAQNIVAQKVSSLNRSSSCKANNASNFETLAKKYLQSTDQSNNNSQKKTQFYSPQITPRNSFSQINQNQKQNFNSQQSKQKNSVGQQQQETKGGQRDQFRPPNKSLKESSQNFNSFKSQQIITPQTPATTPRNFLGKSATFNDKKSSYPKICEQECKEVLQSQAVQKLVALFEQS